MTKSMTGYGAAKGTSEKVEITVEIKGVNSRYLDLSVKLPRLYIMLEEPIKTLVGKFVSRGKVDVFVTFDTSKSDDVDVKINHPLANAYVSAFNELFETYSEFNLSKNVGIAELSRFPDVLQISKRELETDKLSSDVCEITQEALIAYNIMREREGGKLKSDIKARLDEIEKLVGEIEGISPRIIEDYTSRLKARMHEFLNNKDYDEQRVLMEVAVFADRIAINEETVRLRSHIAQLRDIMSSSEPVGRKIDFLVQEFNREANTIGSKGIDAQLAKLVVELKSEIEKIREQAQNIE